MPGPPTRLRLFVAAYPAPDVAARMAGMVTRMALPAGRPTAPDQIHLTLQFIGETDERQVAGVMESVQRSAAGILPFALSPGRLVALPKASAARLVALTTDAPAPLLEIVRRLAHRLARKPRRNAADRFSPHLTLYRITGPPARIELPSAPISEEPYTVNEILLMRSVLLPTGARHDALARIPLPG